MTIVLIGLDYRQTPLALRERVSLSGAALTQMQTRLSGDDIREVVIVSTCNRLEVYAAAADGGRAADLILDALAAHAQQPLDLIQEHVHMACDGDAVRHLMRVASGLESLVVGETEILGQLNAALRHARHAATVGPLLSRLFHAALHAGKRARAETAISQHTLSVSHAAVRLAKQQMGDIRQARVLILGAGRMAELAVWALKAQGVADICLCNRSAATGRSLAARLGCDSIAWEQHTAALSQADIIIAATSAPVPILTAASLSHTPQRRIFIDIAVPRNIAEDVRSVPQVSLYNLDDLQGVVAQHRARRQQDISRVEAIIEQEERAYQSWRTRRRAIPAIRALRERTEAMAAEELQRTLQRLPDLSSREQAVMSQLVHRLVNKFLHAPTTALSEHAATEGLSRSVSRVFADRHEDSA